MKCRSAALTLLLLPGMLAAQTAPKQPECKANRLGERLLTTAVFPNGYIVEGPWLVVGQRSTIADRRTALAVAAVIDRIIEFDPTRGERSATPFPGAIEVVFEGETEEEVMASAAKVWCTTVTKARSGIGDLRKANPLPGHRVT
jgi:hypothetical protein